MAKEQVKHLSAVFTSMFAHAGHITKEEAQEISGMDDHEFEKAYEAAANINKNNRLASGQKRDRFMAHFF
jgi:hypothetical protein